MRLQFRLLFSIVLFLFAFKIFLTPAFGQYGGLSVTLYGRVGTNPWSSFLVNATTADWVQFRANVTGAVGSIRYRFYCNSTDTLPREDTTTTVNPLISVRRCNYTVTGLHNAKVTVNNALKIAIDTLPISVRAGPTPTPTPTPTPVPLILSGDVLVDSGANNCASGTTPYASGARVTIRTSPGGVQTATGLTSTSNPPPIGSYSINDSTAHGNKTADISNLTAEYGVKRVNFDLGGWTTAGLTGFQYGPFNFSANHTLSWCLSNTLPWFVVGDGDVRSGNLVDSLPPGKSPSSSPFSVFFSSNLDSVFGSGLEPTWVVNKEYSYNDDPKTKQGLFSYTFFINRAKIKAVTVTPMPGCPTDGSACTIDLKNFATGVYRSAGNLTIDSQSLSFVTGSHVIILVNGTLTIKSNIKVPSGVGNLLVFAAKGDINIDPAVGTSPPAAPCGTSACTNIEGIYTAEGSITLQSVGNTCADGSTADKQFTLAGNFVTNALKPFKVGGTGKFDNKRSLCAVNDATFPVFVIQSRYDFVPQLTDFYKVPSLKWKEVNP